MNTRNDQRYNKRQDVWVCTSGPVSCPPLQMGTAIVVRASSWRHSKPEVQTENCNCICPPGRPGYLLALGGGGGGGWGGEGGTILLLNLEKETNPDQTGAKVLSETSHRGPQIQECVPLPSSLKPCTCTGLRMSTGGAPAPSAPMLPTSDFFFFFLGQFKPKSKRQYCDDEQERPKMGLWR